MESNFICTNQTCRKKKFVVAFITKYNNDSTEHFDKKTRQTIVCDDCKSVCEHIPKEGVPEFNTFSSLSKEDRKKMLTKRATEHFNKEIKEKKNELVKKAVGDFKKG